MTNPHLFDAAKRNVFLATESLRDAEALLRDAGRPEDAETASRLIGGAESFTQALEARGEQELSEQSQATMPGFSNDGAAS